MKYAVIFDVYKTLFDIKTDENDLGAYEPISRWLGYHGIAIGAKKFFESYRRIVKDEIESNRREYPEVEIGRVFQKLIRQAAKKVRKDEKALIEELALQFRIYTTKRIEIFPETKSVLDRLSKKARLAVVSNAQRLFTVPEMEMFDLMKYFKPIVFSSDAGVKKPSPKIFKKALRSLKIRPEQAVYIGDSLFDDIWGAKRIGMKTVWLNRGAPVSFPNSFERPAPDAEVKITDYRKLPDAVCSLFMGKK